jgi:hypothetical protein
MRRGDGRRLRRCARRRSQRPEIRLVVADDRIDGLEHRHLHDRARAYSEKRVRRRLHDRRLHDGVPIRDRVGMRTACAEQDKGCDDRATESFANRPGFRLPIRGGL